jgi:hypothetical protein
MIFIIFGGYFDQSNLLIVLSFILQLEPQILFDRSMLKTSPPYWFMTVSLLCVGLN